MLDFITFWRASSRQAAEEGKTRREGKHYFFFFAFFFFDEGGAAFAAEESGGGAEADEGSLGWVGSALEAGSGSAAFLACTSCICSIMARVISSKRFRYTADRVLNFKHLLSSVTLRTRSPSPCRHLVQYLVLTGEAWKSLLDSETKESQFLR